eukprot:m.137021 g.137021  ORF g.137021 m.137021 type:complete len:239 (-) comp29898_c3_seq1:526-1242(-)
MTDGTPISWPVGDGEAKGLAYGEAGKPGMLVIQEWWGIDFEVKAHAAHIASKGYRCIVPDLYKGKLAHDAEEAGHLFGSLNWPGAIQDIRGAVACLKKEGCPKVGVTGFCMGGALTIASAVLIEDVACGAPFYGICGDDLADVTKLTKPLCGFFGNDDHSAGFSDAAACDAFEAKLKTSPASGMYQLVRYDGVGHAFMNATEEGIARRIRLGQSKDHQQKTVDSAWSTLFAFFEKHLA